MFEFEDEQTAKSVQEKWSDTYLGGNKGMKIPGELNTVGIIKYVYDDHFQPDMERDILQTYPGVIKKCEFQKRRSDNSFNGMIKVEFNTRDDLLKVIKERIKFCNQRYIVEEFKRTNRVIKCAKCQGWGHVYRYCTKSAKCGKCGDKHETRSCSMTSGYKCCHCNGPSGIKLLTGWELENLAINWLVFVTSPYILLGAKKRSIMVKQQLGITMTYFSLQN